MTRESRACDTCRNRKIRCDYDSKTICNRCARHGLACTVTKPQARKKRRTTQSRSTLHDRLSERLKLVEENVAQILTRRESAARPASSTDQDSTTHSGKDCVLTDPEKSIAGHSSPGEQPDASELPDPFPSPYSITNASNAAFGQIHFSGRHLGKIGQHAGLPVLSDEGRKWLSARTGEDVSFHRFQALANQYPSSASTQVPAWPPQQYELPDQEVIWRLLNEFQDSAFRLFYPILDRTLFAETVALAYWHSDEPPSLERVAARCCVFSFLSIACLFRTGGNCVNCADTDSCALKAHYIMAESLEEGSLTGLQAVVMLHLHHIMTGRVQSAAMMHAVACRWIFMLGGHVYRPVEPYGAELTLAEREARQIRILFWLCYLIDKDVALRLNQPPLMSDEFCELTRPDGYPSTLIDQLADDIPDLRPRDHESLNIVLLGDLRLAQLKSEIARLLYSAQAARKTDAELLRDIRQLDDELETWRLSIPTEYRPTLSISQTSQIRLPDKPDILTRMRYIMLHLEYHHLMTTIHRASWRCLTPCSGNNFQASDPSSVRQSSMALALEASRSTLVFLRAAVHGLVGECFWLMVFYPTAAIFSLFLNIVSNPLGPEAKADLELLSSASDLVRHMPVGQLTSRELGHMDLVDSFVEELVRLGNLAIDKEMRNRE